MSDRRTALTVAQNILTAPRWEAALATTIIGTAFGTHLIDATMGIAARITIVAGLVVLAVLGLIARQGTIEWRGLLPVSLLVFLGWMGLSIIWSEYQWASLGSIAYQLGAHRAARVYVGSLRDPIQVVRAFGDVLRVALRALDRDRDRAGRAAGHRGALPRDPGQPRIGRPDPGHLRGEEHLGSGRRAGHHHLRHRMAHQFGATGARDRLRGGRIPLPRAHPGGPRLSDRGRRAGRHVRPLPPAPHLPGPAAGWRRRCWRSAPSSPAA